RSGHRSARHAPPRHRRPARAVRERRPLPGAAMRISVRWLRELCPVTLSDEEIARKLTMAGLEVEGLEQRSIGPGVVVGRIASCKPIEGSAHLTLCMVDDRSGSHQVVCGAPNAAAGVLVPF